MSVRHLSRRVRENPVDFVKHRALWLGGLAAVAAVAIGGVAYAAGKSAGASQSQTQSVAYTIPGAGTYSNTYPKGSIITINLPSGGQWSGSGVQVTTGNNFNTLSAPMTGRRRRRSSTTAAVAA